jgi:hypothetical protein
VVDNEEASGDGVAAAADRVRPRGTLDWREILAARPDLSPPGYEEAVKDANARTAERQRLKVEAEAVKKTTRGPAKQKKTRRR